MVQQHKCLSWGLLVLRLGLGGFLVLCAFDKIISPQTTVNLIFDYSLYNVAPAVVMILGGVELAFSLLFLVGMYKTWTYGIAFLMQAFLVTVFFQNLLWPFGNNHLFLMLIPVFFAFGSLFFMRNLDTKWTLTKKPGMFS